MNSSADRLRWVGLIGILTIAVMRCMIVFVPHALFDTDPAHDTIPLAAMAQAGSLWLDVLLLASCAVGLFGEWCSGRKLSFLACAFAFAPMPVVFWHGSHDATHLWRGSTWAAAMVACTTLAHLARDRAMRRIALAILLATVVPLLVRGSGQMTWEHADTLREWERVKPEFLALRGWPPDSSAARIYERRLLQAQPTGWFTTSNVFATLAIFGAVMWLGLSVAAMRQRLSSGWMGTMALCGIAAGAGVWCTGSKGAFLAAMIGMTITLAPLLLTSVANLFAVPRIGGAIIPVLIAMTLAAVAVRGTLLPESFAGDKSLLFRWHYIVASVRMMSAHRPLGVGPDGFQDAYAQFRVPRNPEEVQSAHSMFWDWLTTLGMPAGAAWISLSFYLLVRTGLHRRAEIIDAPEPKSSSRHVLFAVLAVLALGLAPAIAIERAALDPPSIFTRCLGLVGFGVMAMMNARLLDKVDDQRLRFVLIGAIAAVAVHGQIEMTFQQPGSVVWALCVIGVAGALPASAERVSRSRIGLAVTVVFATAAAALAWFGAIPATRRETALYAAAGLIQPLPNDAKSIVDSRRLAAVRLVRAYRDHWPRDSFLLEAAARQLVLAAEAAQPKDRALLLRLAAETLAGGFAAHHRPSTLGAEISALAMLAAQSGDVADWDAAITVARHMTTLDPNGLSTWRQLGEVLWTAGRRVEAAAAYQRALECDANFALDEEKRLDPRERELIRQRIADRQ